MRQSIILVGVIVLLIQSSEYQNRKIKGLEEAVDFLVWEYQPEVRYDEHIEQKILKLTDHRIPADELWEMSQAIYDYTAEYKVPENIIIALLLQESGFNRYAISSVGAIGIGQIMSYTAKEIARDLKLKEWEYNLYNIRDNIRFSIYYLYKMYRMFGSYSLAIKAYNAGPNIITAVLKGKREYPKVTEEYYKTIIKSAKSLK